MRAQKYIEYFFSRVFNISKHEIPRVSIAWVLKFLLHTLTVLGFTVTLALFVGEMGIQKLPFLFIFQALLTIAGTLFFSHIIRTFSKAKSFVVGGAGLFFLSGSAYFFQDANPFF